MNHRDTNMFNSKNVEGRKETKQHTKLHYNHNIKKRKLVLKIIKD